MANWSHFSRTRTTFFAFLLLFPFALDASPLPVYKPVPPALWGFFGHKRINRIAVFTLPPEMLGFFKEHIEYITEHAVDPDKRRYAVDDEAQRHYIDIDHYAHNDLDPFENVPRKWDDAIAKFTEDTLQAY